MKNPLAVILSTFLLCMVGCGGNFSAKSSITEIPLITSADTNTPTTVKTATPSPVPTSTATWTPTPSQTATPGITPIFTHTLSPEQRKDYIYSLLTTKKLCDLPCWLGTLPGTTTWRETETFLYSIGARYMSIPSKNGIIYHGANIGLNLIHPYIINVVSYQEGKGIIESITIHTEGYYNLEGFRSIWGSYSPEVIVKEYGKPSRVWIETWATFSEHPYSSHQQYFFWLFYDQLGFLIKFRGITPYLSRYQICPSLYKPGNLQGSIDIYLQAPENPEPIESLARLEDVHKIQIKPLEEASGITIDDMVNLLTQPGVLPCFYTPRNIW